MLSELKVTVITSVLNAASAVERVISSVSAQDYPLVQYIVVDGGSTDNTLNIIDQYHDIIDHVVGGPDSGIAEAMNKGLAVATGDLVLFLHADDHFHDEHSLRDAVAHVEDLDHVWAFDILFGEHNQAVRASPRPFNAWAWFKNPLPHQGVLCPRWVFERIGNFDETLRIDMDYEFWLRVMRAGIPLRRTGEILAVMGNTGISSQCEWPVLRERFAEERTIQWRHREANPLWWLLPLYWPLYLGYRRVRSAMGY